MIILFPAGSEALLQEIYAIPGITRKDGGTSDPVKLGIPAKSKDGRLAHSHPFGPQQIEWIMKYAPSVEVLDELPKDWQPLDETSDPSEFPMLGDLELQNTKPTNVDGLLEPDDKTVWERPRTTLERNTLREIRKSQWQATLPNDLFVTLNVTLLSTTEPMGSWIMRGLRNIWNRIA